MKDPNGHQTIDLNSSVVFPLQGQKLANLTPGTTIEDLGGAITDTVSQANALGETSLDRYAPTFYDDNDENPGCTLGPDAYRVGEDSASTNVIEHIMGIVQKLSPASAPDEVEEMILQCYIQLCERRAQELPTCITPGDNGILSMGGMLLKTPRDFKQAHILESLGGVLLKRFNDSQNEDDINWAITCYEKAVSLTGFRDEKLPNLFVHLGDTFLYRFQMKPDDDPDISQAISYFEQAVYLTAEGHPRFAEGHARLGTSFTRRFQSQGNASDIQQAIMHNERAIQFFPDGDNGIHALRANLGGTYMLKFEDTGDIEDVNRAIDALQSATTLCPKDHPLRADWLSTLGLSYCRRFEGFGKLADLNQAIEYQTQSIGLTPQGDPYIPELLANLGVSHVFRFKRSGQMSDIEKALVLFDQAVDLIPDDHRDRAGCLDSLADALVCRFERLGTLSDLDRAITLQQQAVSLTSQINPERPGRLNNLGNSFAYRYDHLKERDDLDQSISYLTEALEHTSSHADIPERLNNLGISLMTLAAESKRLEDMDEAIEKLKQVELLTPADDSERPLRLFSLGSSLLERYELSKFNQDTSTQRLLDEIDQAIGWFNQALLLTPEGHGERHLSLNHLGGSFNHRYAHSREVADINQAISFQEEAVACIPDGHFDKPQELSRLGNLLGSRFEGFGNPADLSRSISLLEEAAKSSSGNALVRFEAACNWARLAFTHNISSPLDAYDRAMDLIPSVVWLGSSINHRYKDILSISEVVIEAVAVAITSRAYDLAVEWLEEGRSIVWKQMMQLRTPLDDLRQVNADLADRIEATARQLECASSMNSGKSGFRKSKLSLEQDGQNHRRLAEDWERHITEARQIPQFSDFLRPKKLEHFVSVADSGPVAIINVHNTRCDALVLLPRAGMVKHIPLVDLSHTKVAQLCDNLKRSLHHSNVRQRGERALTFASEDIDEIDISQSVLVPLWSDVVKPVLEGLGYLTSQPPEELPRIVWCATGLLAFLPLHAAGDYGSSTQESKVFNHVISSYTPTLSALQVPRPNPSNFHGLLLVGQAASAGYSPLPGTVEELDQISRRATGFKLKQLDGEKATTSAVLDAMGSYSWVHLACHASQNLRDPTASAFCLHDGLLNLATVTEKSLKHAGLAFLSACQTATGDETLSDEAVHLASGMIMAGYPSVIATMWSIQDKDAPLIADRVYAELFEGGAADSSKAAMALHKAVGCLREKVGETAFASWVPYIYFGL